MNVTDDELRALVRDSIARLHGRTASDPIAATAVPYAHASHARLPRTAAACADGASDRAHCEVHTLRLLLSYGH